jgi:hypothetical protein
MIAHHHHDPIGRDAVQNGLARLDRLGGLVVEDGGPVGALQARAMSPICMNCSLPEVNRIEAWDSILSLTFHADAAHCRNGGPLCGAAANLFAAGAVAQRKKRQDRSTPIPHFLLTFGGRHLRSAVDVPGPRDRGGPAAGTWCAVRRRNCPVLC